MIWILMRLSMPIHHHIWLPPPQRGFLNKDQLWGQERSPGPKLSSEQGEDGEVQQGTSNFQTWDEFIQKCTL